MRQNPMNTWNLVLVASMIGMVGIVGYHYLTPMPSFAMSQKGQQDQIKRAREATYDNREIAAKSKAAIELATWSEDPEIIGPKALAKVTAYAKTRRVIVASFRPQKSVQDGTLVRLPYLLSVEGTYKDVVSFVRDIENPSNKLVVNMVQFAASDGESSAVRATIGLWALQVGKDEPKKAGSTARPTRATRAGGAG